MQTDPGTGGPAHGRQESGWKRWGAIIGLVVVVVILIALVSLTTLLMKPPGEGPHLVPVAVVTNTVAPVPAVPTGTTPSPPGTTRAPATLPPEGTPAPRGTPTPAASATTSAPVCVPAGPPGFTVTVSPVQASAARGETVDYHMTIDAQNCFSDPISMTLTARVLFLSSTYDLGTQEPPYPKTFEYPLSVPGTLIPGTTVDGVLVSSGGGITQENYLTLTVR